MDAVPVSYAGESVAPMESAAEGPRANARLVDYAYGKRIALPTHTTLEVLESPVFSAVPGAVYYAYGLMPWQGQWLPLIDLGVLLEGYADSEFAVAEPPYALVLAYQRAPGAPIEHGAIALPSLPETVSVSDNDACPLPADSDLWPLLALSCFLHREKPTPIIDPGRLFGTYLGG